MSREGERVRSERLRRKDKEEKRGIGTLSRTGAEKPRREKSCNVSSA